MILRKKSRHSAAASKKTNKTKWLAIVVFTLTAAAIITVLILSYSRNNDVYTDKSEEDVSFVQPDGSITVRFLDVGQGDCILITSNNGKHVVIDAGTYERPGCAMKYLDSYGVDEIEYLVLTHPDADHIGDADKIITNKKVKNVIMTNEAATSATFESLVTALEASEDTNIIEGIFGSVYYADDVKLSVLSPIEGYSGSSNDSSIVVMAEYGKTKFLFTGDTEASAEADMIHMMGSKLDCDVLKIAHHGSSSSSTEEFLKYTSPLYAVISCGENNDYGHPHDIIIERLKKLGISYFRTDKNGTITFTSDGAVIGTETER